MHGPPTGSLVGRARTNTRTATQPPCTHAAPDARHSAPEPALQRVRRPAAARPRAAPASDAPRTPPAPLGVQTETHARLRLAHGLLGDRARGRGAVPEDRINAPWLGLDRV